MCRYSRMVGEGGDNLQKGAQDLDMEYKIPSFGSEVGRISMKLSRS